MPRILVTGATGFIGKNLIKSFHAKGYALRCVYRKQLPPQDSPETIDWVQISDFTSKEAWTSALSEIDFVIHLAALAHQVGDTQLTDEDYRLANAEPSEVIATAARDRGVSRIVFISSIAAVCSESEDLVDERTPLEPSTPYGRSKLEAENRIESALEGQSTTDWVALRPTLVYGPGNPGNMGRIASLIRLPVPLPFGGFDNHRTFLYIDNLLSAIESSLTAQNVSGKRYILCDDEGTSTAGLAREIAAATGKRKWVISLPAWILKLMVTVGDFAKNRLNVSTGIDSYSLNKLKASLRASNQLFKNDAVWTPPFSLSQGISRTFSDGEK